MLSSGGEGGIFTESSAHSNRVLSRHVLGVEGEFAPKKLETSPQEFLPHW